MVFGLEDSELIIRILLAILFGALIGYDRELKHKPAGLRTHMLVALGAVIFTMASLTFVGDDARVAAGIVTGIGFLGAGTIIAHRGHVEGITTAATLWVAASIGLGVGLGEYVLSFVGALAVFGVLQISYIERKIGTKKSK